MSFPSKIIGLIAVSSLTLLATNACRAQGDTLFVQLKNGTVDKIPVGNIQKIAFENVAGAAGNSGNAEQSALLQNYPNPVEGYTFFRLQLPSEGSVKIAIYNIGGTLIGTLMQNCHAGANLIKWNALDASGNAVTPGVYYYELHVNGHVEIRKMIVR